MNLCGGIVDYRRVGQGLKSRGRKVVAHPRKNQRDEDVRSQMQYGDDGDTKSVIPRIFNSHLTL